MRELLIVLCVAALIAALSPAWGCDAGSVCDAARHAKRDVHRLCLFTNASDPSAAETMKRLTAWVEREAEGINISTVRVDADGDSVDWREYGIPGKPPSLPVVALIGQAPGPSRRAFVIDHWEPGPSDADLAVLKTSPAREAVKNAVVDVWAAILYAPGSGPEGGKKEAVLNAASRQWTADHPPGVTVVRFDRADPGERLLCAFAGIERDGPDWAGVVFGRGKLLAPPLEGDDLTEANLNQLLTGLTAACTCLQQAMTLGVDVPMTWEPALDAKIAAAAPTQGYTEVSFGEQTATTPTPTADVVPPRGANMFLTTLAPLLIAACAVLAATAVILWRNRRRAGASTER